MHPKASAVDRARSRMLPADGEVLPPDTGTEAQRRKDLAFKAPFESERGSYGNSICFHFSSIKQFGRCPLPLRPEDDAPSSDFAHHAPQEAARGKAHPGQGKVGG